MVCADFERSLNVSTSFIFVHGRDGRKHHLLGPFLGITQTPSGVRNSSRLNETDSAENAEIALLLFGRK